MFMSLTSGGSALYQKGGGGGLEMLSASSIPMFQPKHNPLVAVTLSLPLSSRLLRLSQREAARGRFTKHRARMRRYRYHDHLTHSGRPEAFGEIGSQLGKDCSPASALSRYS